MNHDEFQRRQANANKILRIVFGTATLEEQAEMEIGDPAVDLRSIPRAQWENHSEVALSPDVEKFVTGQHSFTQEELNAIEDRLRAFHGVAWPDWINCSFQNGIFRARLGKDLLVDEDPVKYLEPNA